MTTSGIEVPRDHDRLLREAVLRSPRVRTWLLPRLPQGLLLRGGGTVLFVCVENACRSLMAEALFNARAPPAWRARSAGTEPAPGPNPRTGPMLEELGVALPDHPPQAMTAELLGEAQVVVTMGCLDSDRCPAVLLERRPRDWELPDPARLDDAGFRAVRDEIARRVAELLREVAGPRTSSGAPGAPV